MSRPAMLNDPVEVSDPNDPDEVDDDVSASMTSLRDQYFQLAAAVQQITTAGTDAQRETASAALAEARKTIYRLLAED